VATGEERLRIDRKASDLHFSDDGKTLTAAVDGAIYRWDTATGKALTPDAGDSGVAQVLVSADGSRVVTRGEGGDAHVWDGTTGKHLRRFRVSYQRGLAISPDGRFLAWPVDDYDVTFAVPQTPGSLFYGTHIRFYDLAADKAEDRISTFKGDVQDLAFTADGKRLVTAEGQGGVVRVWNVETAKEERSFRAVPDFVKDQSYYLWRTVISPDGRTVVKTFAKDTGGRLGLPREQPHLVQLWDVATGTELPHLDGGSPLDGAFSPDGRLVVTGGGNAVCAVATGERVAALPDDLYVRAAAFSRDGRFLATAGGDAIQVWEVATWTRRNDFKGHVPTTLTFAPDGQLLSGSLDTTVLAWDTRPPRGGGSVTLERAWGDLAEREAGQSFRSEGRFLAAPAEAVKLFAEKIKPAEALDPRQVQRWLADLDSNDFAVRQAASTALTGADEQTTPYLEDCLKGTASAEVRARVAKILEQRRRATLTPEQVRRTRAVLVLERIGDGEARSLLKRWAGGPAAARLTAEAAAALKRLEAVSETKR
jgi:WD40 repeat protein